jgi:hypothetical protein
MQKENLELRARLEALDREVHAGRPAKPRWTDGLAAPTGILGVIGLAITIFATNLNLARDVTASSTTVVNLTKNFDDFKMDSKTRLEDFKTATKVRFDKVDARFDKLEEKLDTRLKAIEGLLSKGWLVEEVRGLPPAPLPSLGLLGDRGPRRAGHGALEMIVPVVCAQARREVALSDVDVS